MQRTLNVFILASVLCTGTLNALAESEVRVPASAPAQARPNIILVIADQLRYQSCGFAGDPDARTPNLDKLAAQGVVFRNAISGHPVCAPFRASLFTGKYTTSTGMVINELRMNPNHECMGHVLTRSGYETAYIGKWHLWANELGNHYDPKNSFIPPGPYRLGFDGFWAAYNFHHQNYKGYYHTDSPEKIPVKGYEPDGQTEMAMGLVDKYARGDKPFAMILSIGTPHDPWGPDNVPSEYYAMFGDVDGRPRFKLPPNYKPENDPYADAWGRFKNPEERANLLRMKRGYYAMIANLDWNLGRLMKAIDDAGVRDNTILVFTSDHGEMMGAQGRRAKNIFYEEALRVPFVMRWPGRIPAGNSSDACLNTPDILPTLLGMAGLPIPPKVEGMDLSHCAFGKPGPEPEAALLQNTGACAIWEDGYEWRALRDKRYTYAIYRKDRKELLFDNVADPFQMKNLTGDADHARVLAEFRGMLDKRMDEIEDTFEASSYYRDHWVKDRIITRVR